MGGAREVTRPHRGAVRDPRRPVPVADGMSGIRLRDPVGPVAVTAGATAAIGGDAPPTAAGGFIRRPAGTGGRRLAAALQAVGAAIRRPLVALADGLQAGVAVRAGTVGTRSPRPAAGAVGLPAVPVVAVGAAPVAIRRRAVALEDGPQAAAVPAVPFRRRVAVAPVAAVIRATDLEMPPLGIETRARDGRSVGPLRLSRVCQVPPRSGEVSPATAPRS